ncbi:MAG TPA: hypothetical protein H9827_08510 [Candidatus Luteimonas excrementigallinarum]|nr:hypothetical protein [Candidatus Luteimonas excrementigallinarum]
MRDRLLEDIDNVLLERVQRLARRRGWDPAIGLEQVLERGLRSLEAGDGMHFESREAEALQAALEAMGNIPDDPGFAMIGRVARSH